MFYKNVDFPVDSNWLESTGTNGIIGNASWYLWLHLRLEGHKASIDALCKVDVAKNEDKLHNIDHKNIVQPQHYAHVDALESTENAWYLYEMLRF